MTHNFFLYATCFSALGGIYLLGMSYAPLRKSPAPALARRALRITAAFGFASVVPWGLLWLSERDHWFADRPGRDLLFIGGIMLLMGATLWFNLRALYPLATELRRLKQEAAGEAPPLPSRLKTALVAGSIYAFASLCLSLLSPYLFDPDRDILASHVLLYPPATFLVGFAAGWLMPRATSPSTFSARMWGWYVFGVVIGLARVRLSHLVFDLVGTAVTSFLPALLFAWIFGYAERGLAAPRSKEPS